ncbi:hypothetical protein GQX74_009838 [Glossina fuscipes]|nr:hypothetical protein GQX74_009838 [Glossina fuscipes]
MNKCYQQHAHAYTCRYSLTLLTHSLTNSLIRQPIVRGGRLQQYSFYSYTCLTFSFMFDVVADEEMMTLLMITMMMLMMERLLTKLNAILHINEFLPIIISPHEMLDCLPFAAVVMMTKWCLNAKDHSRNQTSVLLGISPKEK